jgi:hypothetical protein
VAIAFTLAGSFAAVPNSYWAQLAPYSHASDVAMGVFLPAMLVLAAAFLKAAEKRERRFFFVVALGVALTLAMVHPRELVQFLVYIVAFAALMACQAGGRRLAQRAAILAGFALCALLVYSLWYQWSVPIVDALVTEQRADLTELARRASWTALFDSPLRVLDSYTPGASSMSYGWNPVVLLAAPALFAVFARRPLAWLFAAGIGSYVLILTIPLLAFTFVYLTYYEILFTPVRNVIFFIHVLAGAGLYAAAAALARFRPLSTIVLAHLSSVLLVLAVRHVGPVVAERPRLLFAAVLAGYTFAMWRTWGSRIESLDDTWLYRPPRQWILAMLIMTVCTVVMTRIPASSPLVASSAEPAMTPASLFAETCKAPFCAPPRALAQFAQQHVPADGIIALDQLEAYPSSLYMPQQMVVWPGNAEGFIVGQDALFPTYEMHNRRAKWAYGEQPLLNAQETPAERRAFLRDLRVTHVLVNPRLYATVKPALTGIPELFRPLYDDGRWALYEVVP